MCRVRVVLEKKQETGTIRDEKTEERGDTAGQSEDMISGEGQERRPDEDDRKI